MTSTETAPDVPATIIACTISRDVQNFDLLIEDMETLLGEGWGDLGFDEFLRFLGQPDAQKLEFVALAIDAFDEDDADQLVGILAAAQDHGIKVILIAEDVTPTTLHRLLRAGADEFIPYPLPEGELATVLERLRRPPTPAQETAGPVQTKPALKGGRNGVLMAVHGLAGGCGATTLAVNLAYELATVAKRDAPKVCLLDLDLQFGSVATYLDLPRRDAVMELLTNPQTMDGESFGQALASFEDKFQVFTAPTDILPLDMLAQDDVQRLLEIAREHFDYVIVDMPTTLVSWTENVLTEAQLYFAMVQLDMRSAQNALRMRRALMSESLPVEKLRFVLNHAPRFTDLQGKSRIKKMAESLDVALDLQLPDGGRVVSQAGDHGIPLAQHAGKNALRKEIAKLARSLHALGQTDAEAA